MADGRRRITILGATGSIGASTIDVVERHRDAYQIEALTANGNIERLVELARRLRPRFVATGDAARHAELKDALAGEGIETGAGPQAVIEAAQRPADWVMAAIVGAAGLEPTLAAIRRGVVVAFASKECLVCAGDLMMAEIRRSGATLLPVDSEHNAIFQVFDADHPDSVDRIILTASGGPFRTASRAEMAAATPADAVRHPTWSMGAKISVDSATMMNKGLERIEAHHLFALPSSRLEIVVHPQSVVHSLVAYVDGSVLAQLGPPDMRTPIAYTLAWPGRLSTAAERLDLARIGQLTFEPPDPERFPALALARAALEAGGTAPAVLNAANEVAVAGFLDRRIGFLDIARVVEATLAEMPVIMPGSLEEVASVDAEARRRADGMVGIAAA